MLEIKACYATCAPVDFKLHLNMQVDLNPACNQLRSHYSLVK